MSNLDTALEYLLKYKFSVVPFRGNKKGSLIPTYKEFQGRRPTEDEVREWWTKWPDAMIGVITGPVSDLMAFDFDWYKLKDTEKSPLKDLVPDTIPGPICISPEGGYHKLFRYPENGTVLNSIDGVLKGFDIKGLKGVIQMPPSINDKGLAYRWMGGRAIHEVAVQAVATPILNKVIQLINTKLRGVYIEGRNIGDANGRNKAYQGVTKHNIELNQGNRGDALFHIVNSCLKGGMEVSNIYKVAEIVCKNCNPPFSVGEIPARIKSAIDRAEARKFNLTEELKKFISVTYGSFSRNEASQSVTNHNIPVLRATLHRLCQGVDAIIEPDKARGDGWFRRIENNETEIDFKNATGDFLPIKWPFGIEQWFNTAPKNIIIVAGEPDSGKTAFLLNLAGLNNFTSIPVFYFSSEMGEFEMRERLKGFTKPLIDGWRMKVFDRSCNFADVIRPDAINIIDFLEIHEDFYKVGLYIKQIFDKLNKGIAVIALQKNPGKEQGLGGMRSIEKARLAINMERGGRLIIDKCKNWATMNNPRGLAIEYSLVGGCHFQVLNGNNGSNGWFYADGVRQLGEREEKQKQYQQPWNDKLF